LQSAVVAVNTLPFGPLNTPRGGEVKNDVFELVVSSVVVDVPPLLRVTSSRKVTDPPTLRVA